MSNVYDIEKAGGFDSKPEVKVYNLVSVDKARAMLHQL